MSHNVTMKDCKITDLGALKAAIAELNKETGSNMELSTESGTFRGWLSGNEKADAVIKMHGFKYDIGLLKQPDGSYVPRFEDMAARDFGSVTGVKGRPQKVNEGGVCDLHGPSAIIGRLQQRMNVIVAEKEAARGGMSTTRDVNEKTGIINVVATIT